MVMKLTFSNATLGWRFAHTQIFLTHFIQQWLLLQDVQLKNLDEYWNIDKAGGLWLNQIGELFKLARPVGLIGNQFILNIDKLNDPAVVLNGDSAEILDKMFRILIKLRNRCTLKLFSMKNIADVMYYVFGQENIKVEFRENTDRFNNPKAQYFRIFLTFKNSDDYRVFVGIIDTNPTLFFGKPMGVSYDTFCFWNPDL